MDRHQFNEHLADAARSAAEELDGAHTLDRAVTLPTELIERCSFAGVSVLSPHGIDIHAVSHQDVRLIEELQHKLGEGPVHLLRHVDTVISGNVDTDNRWPDWGTHVASQFRIRSAMAFRLFTDGQTLAALDLYSEEPDAFTHDDHVDGLVTAAQVGVLLSSSLELEQMHTALRSRQNIGEAVGMLRERFGLSSEQAFGVLKRLSSQQNVKLVHVAQHVVDTGSLPELPG
jgi:GAF domain-containing protein